MVIRIAEFEQPPAFHTDPEKYAAFRRWISSQPGYLHGWHATEPGTGRLLSVSVWADRASIDGMRTRPFPGGPLGASPSRLTIFEHAEAI